MTDISAARQELDSFVTPFEQRPPEADIAEAGAAFSNGMESLFLDHMGNMIQSDHKDGGPLLADLRLYFDAEDGSALHTIVRKYNPKYVDPRPIGRALYRVHMTEQRADGTSGKMVFYSVTAESAPVTRRDVSEDWEEELRLRKQTSPTPDFSKMTREEVDEYLRQSRLRANEAVANLELEVALGLNEQPVGKAEVKALLALLGRSYSLSDEESRIRHQAMFARRTELEKLRFGTADVAESRRSSLKDRVSRAITKYLFGR